MEKIAKLYYANEADYSHKGVGGTPFEIVSDIELKEGQFIQNVSDRDIKLHVLKKVEGRTFYDCFPPIFQKYQSHHYTVQPVNMDIDQYVPEDRLRNGAKYEVYDTYEEMEQLKLTGIISPYISKYDFKIQLTFNKKLKVGDIVSYCPDKGIQLLVVLAYHNHSEGDIYEVVANNVIGDVVFPISKLQVGTPYFKIKQKTEVFNKNKENMEVRLVQSGDETEQWIECDYCKSHIYFKQSAVYRTGDDEFYIEGGCPHCGHHLKPSFEKVSKKTRDTLRAKADSIKENKGLQLKYRISRFDGTPVDKEFDGFILRLDPDQKNKEHLDACRQAVLAYAKAVAPHNPDLAHDVIIKYGYETFGKECNIYSNVYRNTPRSKWVHNHSRTEEAHRKSKVITNKEVMVDAEFGWLFENKKLISPVEHIGDMYIVSKEEFDKVNGIYIN